MGYEIPEPYCWDESFKVFYDQLDTEHKGLFQGIFDCDADRGNTGKFDALYKKCEDHFRTEEGMMTGAGYPDFAPHKKLHEAFLGDLKKLKGVALTDDSVKFAKNWLVNHIKSTDFKYKGKLA